jgi:hypothetical protein
MKKTFLAVIASAFALNASAAELSFNNLGIGYNQIDFSCSSNCDGFNLLGSVEINEMFSASIDYTGISDSGADLDVTYLGLGLRNEYRDNAAVFGQFGLARVSASFNGDSGSINKAFAGVGVRGMMTESIEGEAIVRKVFVNGLDPTLKLTGTYFFTDTVGASVNIETSNGDTGGGIGLRLNF